jgi:ABC-type multidrug transport system ATPase subunit
MTYAIDTRDLVKCYGSRRALDGLTLAVPRFSLLGLIGPNGAGKTTWMMSVAGFLRLSSGSIDLLGSGPFDAATHRGRISILPQDSELPLESRPLELLTHYGMLQGLSRAEARQSAAALLADVHLGDRQSAAIRTLSHGMRKRVMIAQCFIGYPEVILLDEPLSGLDPREVAHMREFLRRRRGRQTVVVSSHNLHDIELVCDHVAFMEKGKAVRVAPLAEVTGASSRLIYRLTSAPSDLAALSAAAPQADLALAAGGLELTCAYDPRACAADQINRLLLPVLLAQGCGILTVAQGASLESEYLKSV